MGSKTGISWTDATWNPVTGCTRISAGCQNCYAEKMAKRLQAMGSPRYSNGFDVAFHYDTLSIPMRWKKPKRIFVNSMSDLFHDDVPESFIRAVFTTMANCQQHIFQVLTKRHKRVCEILNEWQDSGLVLREGYGSVLPNVWLGVTAEDQKNADERIPWLLKTPAAVRFVSVEPMLGLLNVSPYLGKNILPSIHCLSNDVMDGIDWVICGGESGPNARPMHPDWVRSLRDQCVAASVPFFFKQWGEYAPESALDSSITPSTHSLHESHMFSDGQRVYRVGKKNAGMLLYGETWNQFPAVTT